jgi:protein-cysteine N-palmitoyltransferase HHAT
VLHPLCRRLWNSFFPVQRSSGEKENARVSPEAADGRLNQRLSFDYSFALLYLAALHGFSAFKVLLILYVNYNIGTALPRKYVPVATWVFNVGILFANELCEGYKFQAIAQMFSSTSNVVAGGSKGALVSLGQWLDSYGGLQPRWEVLFNITILRLISFNMDRYWAQEQRGASPVEVCAPLLPLLPVLGTPTQIGLIRPRRSNWIPPISRSEKE